MKMQPFQVKNIITLFIVILSIVFCCTPAFADPSQDASSVESDQNGTWRSNLDTFQKYWSQKVLLFSSNLDHKISEWYNEGNESSDSVLLSDPKSEGYVASSWLDDFFKDETYLNTNNKSYVRVRGGYELNQRAGPSFFHNVSARIRLPYTEGRLQLYMGEEIQGNSNLSYVQYKSSNEGIGLRYFLPSFMDRLSTSASVGFSRIDNPYAKIRMEYPILAGIWLLKPTQNFKYSLDNEFEEWTNLFLDRKLSDDEVFRILLQRSTQSNIDGMNYLFQLSYMNTRKYKIGFNYYVALSGRTEDQPKALYSNGILPREGIYEYALGMIWRQKLVKDYLFYQIQPIVSFHEQYNYQTNPMLRMSLELYFGNHR